jgi:hypothetical protein
MGNDYLPIQQQLALENHSAGLGLLPQRQCPTFGDGRTEGLRLWPGTMGR